MAVSVNQMRDLFVGLDYEAPLLDGSRRPYVNLDNAATTPPLREVLEYVNRSAQWYSSVHRGTGFKSQLSTDAFGKARERVASFLHADPDYHLVLFCANTTDAINRLCCRMDMQPGDVVLTTVIEHHSNMLPWRHCGEVDYIKAKWPCGTLDMDDMEAKLRKHEGKVRVVAVTGASNITGHIPRLREIARKAHEHGAYFLVDASQLVAHRPIDLGRADDPERIDFMAFSGHKMYAPFGSGCLVGPRAFFEQGEPHFVGGGSVDLVTLDDVEWTGLPDKEEAGTPNLMGICAMAKAMDVLEEVGMEQVAEHELELTGQAIKRLDAIDGVRIYGAQVCQGNDRVGVIPLISDKYPHALLAAILGYEWGIGVRNGCFCAHPYMEHLLGISEDEVRKWFDVVRQGNRGTLPGFVRVSLGLYNTMDDIEYLAQAIETIHRDGPEGRVRGGEQVGLLRTQRLLVRLRRRGALEPLPIEPH